MGNDTEFLDFCRIKKIFDKGFGFLTSIYFEENVFFHFSKIKDKGVKEKLQGMERGVIYIFYTSRNSRGKRKVDRIWFDIKDIDSRLVYPFIFKIIDCFNGSRINIYELAHVVKLLREAGYINRQQFERLIDTSSIRKIPSVVLSMLSNSEKNNLEQLTELAGEAEENNSGIEKLREKIIGSLYK